jgi:hypothetical protein
MSYKSNIIEYKSCIKCKVLLIITNFDYCNSCKHKFSSTKFVTNVKYRIFMTKFDSKNNKNIKFYLNKHQDSGSGMLISIIPII